MWGPPTISWAARRAYWQLVANGTTTISAYALAPVPLFILMGEILFHSNQAIRTFDALDKFFARVPGRLCFLTIGGGTIFAALMGSAMATTAMLGSLLVPEMVRRGYKKSMIMGPIMGCGALAIVIPPSGLAVLLGSIGRIDIAAFHRRHCSRPLACIVLFRPGLFSGEAGSKLRARLCGRKAPGRRKAPGVGAILRPRRIDRGGRRDDRGLGDRHRIGGVRRAGCGNSRRAQGEFSWSVVVRSLRGTVGVTSMVLLISLHRPPLPRSSRSRARAGEQ